MVNQLTSSSAFLAPRMDKSKSLSPSPLLRNESSIEARLAGGAGYSESLVSNLTLIPLCSNHSPAPHPTTCRRIYRQTRRQARRPKASRWHPSSTSVGWVALSTREVVTAASCHPRGGGGSKCGFWGQWKRMQRTRWMGWQCATLVRWTVVSWPECMDDACMRAAGMGCPQVVTE